MKASRSIRAYINRRRRADGKPNGVVRWLGEGLEYRQATDKRQRRPRPQATKLA